MKWPWGTRMTEIQAKALTEYCLALSQATLIGSVGYIFITETDYLNKILILILGIFVSSMLLFFWNDITQGGESIMDIIKILEDPTYFGIIAVLIYTAIISFIVWSGISSRHSHKR